MADEYIRKQDAIDMCGGYGDLAYMMSTIKPADVVEVKHGEWMSVPEMWGTFDIRYYCSECGKDAIINNSERYVLSDYCPHCFAKMDGKKRK